MGTTYKVCKSLDTTLSLLLKYTVQKYIYPSVLQVHTGSFCVSVVHQTLTWTTQSLMCIRDHSYVCVYTQGLIGRQHNIFDSEKLSQFVSYAPGGAVRTLGH